MSQSGMIEGDGDGGGEMLGIVPIQGNIGVGKSTLIKIFEEECKRYRGVDVVYVPEPLGLWTTPQEIPASFKEDVGDGPAAYSYLDLFYKDPKANSFMFQVYAFCTRASIMDRYIEEARSRGRPFILVSERDLIGDKEVFTMMLASDGLFPREAVPVYDQFWNLVSSRFLPHVKAMVYVKAPAEVCHQRTKARNRTSESKVELGYLERIEHFHERMVSRHEGSIPTVHVDWSSDMKTDAGLKGRVLGQFKDTLDLIIDGDK